MSSTEKTAAPKKEILRFPLLYRLEHWVFAISFITLAITGLIQKYFQSPISLGLISAMGGIENVRVIHRVAATVMMVSVVWHIGVVFYRVFVRHYRLSMLPGLDDAKNMWGWLVYNLGIKKTAPQEGRYTYGEKLEYWAVVWGTVIMAVTGFMMWNPIATTNLLDGQWIPAAKAAHGAEAVLAVLAIIIWHFYNVLVKTLNKSMFHGKLTEKQMAHEHPLELADMKAGVHEVRVDAKKAAHRLRIFVPTFSIIGGLMLVGIVWFVSFEDTALRTIPPVSTVEVFAPLTPTPLPTQAPTPTLVPTPQGRLAQTDWNTGVGPLLANQCGACHVAAALGGLNLTSYQQALTGGNSGPAIVPGEADDSQLVIVQQAGGHPAQLSDSDLSIIIAWIESGAPEALDGGFPTPTTVIASPTPTAIFTPPALAAGADMPLAFDSTIGPLLLEQCGACHAETALGGLNMSTYSLLLAGGSSGPVIVPGEVDSSLLVTIQQAGGHAGQLSDSDLELMIAWIQAGAPETSGSSAAPLTYEGAILPLFIDRCGACHGDTSLGGLNLTVYANVLQGGSSGVAIVPGDPAAGKLIEVQEAGGHPGQLSEDELALVKQWIEANAPEK
jgi:formate dehydrogenase gamma subunit